VKDTPLFCIAKLSPLKRGDLWNTSATKKVKSIH